MKEIKLKARHGINNYLTPVNVDGDELLLSTDGQFVRTIGDKDKIEAIDPEGGPMLSVKTKIPGTELVIKSIAYNKALEGYLLKVNLYDISSYK